DSARAIEMRWRWPPENSWGYLSPSSAASPTCARSCATRPSTSDARASRRTRTGSPTMSRTRQRGFRLAYGDWKIICLRWPRNSMRPPLGASSPTIRRAMVDLPQPDSPTSARVSPRRTSSVTPSTARSSRLPSPSSIRSSQGRETSKSRETASTLSNGARMQPAGGLALFSRHQFGTRAQAALEALGTARVERAAARDRVEAWHRALDLREARAPRACRDARNGGHQPRGIGVPRRMQHVANRPDLDDAARIHDRDAVGGLGDDPHVMGDQHDRRAPLARDALDERDDLRLHRHVERGGRLVGDQQDRLRGERQRDDHALAHAAGELVRVMVEARLRSRDADFGEQRQCPLPQLLSRQPEMRADRLLELLADREQRIERAERVLEHDADAPAADGAQRGLLQP